MKYKLKLTYITIATILAMSLSKKVNAQVEFEQAVEGPRSVMINHYIDSSLDQTVVPVLFMGYHGLKGTAIGAKINGKGLESFGVAYYKKIKDLSTHIFGWIGKSSSIDLALSYSKGNNTFDLTSHLEDGNNFVSGMTSRTLGNNAKVGVSATYDGEFKPGIAVTAYQKEFKYFIEGYVTTTLSGDLNFGLRTVVTLGNEKK